MTISTYVYPASFGGAEAVPGGPLFGGNASFAGTNPFTIQAQGGPTQVVVDSNNPNQSITTFNYGTPQAYTETLVVTQYNNSNYVETSDGTYNYILANGPLAIGQSYDVTPGTPFQLNPAFQTNTVCYASGTLIRTVRGDIAVEALAIDDFAVTTSGALRRVRWLGHRAIDFRTHPRPAEALPIRISTHAFGENRPARDLWVSPGHALCVDVLGEVLIPASSLVNGANVAQVEVERVTYWHVELDGGHEVILAENLPAESYIDVGNRSFFVENGTVALAARPDGIAGTHGDYCRPFHTDGPVVVAALARLDARAIAAGWRHDTSPFADLHVVADGERIKPASEGLTARFHVPASARDVWLVSDAVSPAATTGSADTRQLGVCLAALTLEDGLTTHRAITLDDPRLDVGFHEIELSTVGSRRWTTGRARLPADLWEGCGDSVVLRLDLAGPALPRWIAPKRNDRDAGTVEAA